MPRPFQWIEEAEARRVLIAAVSEHPLLAAAPTAALPLPWLSVRRLLPPPRPISVTPPRAADETADSLADSGG